MGLKKKDREKVDMIIDKYVKAFVWCFNEEYTNKYLERFALMKYESGLYNNDFTHAGLDIFNENDIVDTYDGIDDNKDVNEILKTYFVKTFKKKMKEVLPQHFEEIKKQKKEEKAKEDEAKGKKKKK